MTKSAPRQSCVEALDVTLSTLDLTHDAAALVALCRATAEKIDGALETLAYAPLANSYMKQLDLLRKYVKQPDVIDEDPFDALARKLAQGSGTA